MVLVAELVFGIVCIVVEETGVGLDHRLRRMMSLCSVVIGVETCCLTGRDSMSCSFGTEMECVCAE